MLISCSSHLLRFRTGFTVQRDTSATESATTADEALEIVPGRTIPAAGRGNSDDGQAVRLGGAEKREGKTGGEMRRPPSPPLVGNRGNRDKQGRTRGEEGIGWASAVVCVRVHGGRPSAYPSFKNSGSIRRPTSSTGRCAAGTSPLRRRTRWLWPPSTPCLYPVIHPAPLPIPTRADPLADPPGATFLLPQGD